MTAATTAHVPGLPVPPEQAAAPVGKPKRRKTWVWVALAVLIGYSAERRQ